MHEPNYNENIWSTGRLASEVPLLIDLVNYDKNSQLLTCKSYSLGGTRYYIFDKVGRSNQSPIISNGKI